MIALVVAALLSQHVASGQWLVRAEAALTFPSVDALHVDCSVQSPVASLLARSRLVLHSGDQGACSAIRAVLVGTAKAGEAPASLNGFASPQPAKGHEIDRPRVTLLLSDAVKVELWGNPLVAR